MIKKEFMNWLVDYASGFGIEKQTIGDVLFLRNHYDFYAIRIENVEQSILYHVLLDLTVNGINKHHEVFEIFTFPTHVEINGFRSYFYGEGEELETITDAYLEVLNFIFLDDSKNQEENNHE